MIWAEADSFPSKVNVFGWKFGPESGQKFGRDKNSYDTHSQVQVKEKTQLTLRFWPNADKVRLVEIRFVPPPGYRNPESSSISHSLIPWTNGMRAFALFLILAKAGRDRHETASPKHWLNALRKARDDNANPVDKVFRVTGSLRFLRLIVDMRGRPPDLMSVNYAQAAMPIRDLRILVGSDMAVDEMRTPDRLLQLAERIKNHVPKWTQFPFTPVPPTNRIDPLADLDLEPVPIFEVHPELTERDVLKSYAMERAIYKEAVWPKDVYVKLWRTFPEGGQVLYKKGKPVGGIGMYPLMPSVAELVKRGGLSDAEIAGLLCDFVRNRSAQFWYLSTIELVQGLTRGRERSEAIITLLRKGVPNIIRAVKVGWPIEVLSFGWSDSGVNLLKRFGFKILLEPEQTKNGWPLFSLRLTSATDLDEKLQNLKARTD